MSRESALFSQAVTCLQNGQLEQARRLLNALLQQDPTNEYVWTLYMQTFSTPEAQARAAFQYQQMHGGQPTAVPEWSPRNRFFSGQRWFAGGFFLIVLFFVVGLFWSLTRNPVVADATPTNSSLQVQNEHLQNELANTESQLVTMQAQNNELTSQVEQLSTQYEAVNKELGTIQQEQTLQATAEVSQPPPQSQLAVVPAAQAGSGSIINADQVTVNLKLESNATWSYTFPYSILEEVAIWSNYREGFSETESFRTAHNTIAVVPDYAAFIQADPFKEMMVSLYEVSGSPVQLVRNSWSIVSSLNNIAPDELAETLVHPINTLVRGSGDGEDMAILFASMMVASDHITGVALIFIDAGSPEMFDYPNKILVQVTTASDVYLIDPGDSTIMQRFGDDITKLSSHTWKIK